MSEKPLEEKVEDLLGVFEKKRRKIINEPESEEKFARLEIIDYAIGRVSGIVNRNRKLEKQKIRKAEEKAKAERKAKFEKELEQLNNPYIQEYNVTCRHYCESGGERYCGIDMDMTFCGANCAFATNRPGSVKPHDAVVIVNHQPLRRRK